MPSNTTSTGLTSAGGILALLEETDEQLKIYALQKLDQIVDEFWAEISEQISKIESLYEDEKFNNRQLAALVASKVFFHLGAYGDALTYALGAGELFDVSNQSKYVKTLVGKCIDEYIAQRVKINDTNKDTQIIDERLEKIVERMFDRCYFDGKFKQAVGIAIEARRFDKLEETILKSGDIRGMLDYGVGVCNKSLLNRDLRHTILRIIVKMYHTLPEPDYFSICQCLIFLDDAQEVANILKNLIMGNDDSKLTAYQIAFNLCENSTQQFLKNVLDALPAPITTSPKNGSDTSTTTIQNTPSNTTNTTNTTNTIQTDKKPDAMETDIVNGEKNIVSGEKKPSELEKLRVILYGDISIGLYLEFLYRNSKTDILILKNVKAAVDTRNSVYHSATVFSHGLMHAGTTIDTFLRENLDWLGRATNWAKFSATASLGVIHKGHLKEGMKVLAPYLPKSDGSSMSPYSEGGALYGLGLIHANHASKEISQYLSNALAGAAQANPEIVQHGACLGLGAAAMASQNEEIYEELKNTLYSDNAVAGEAAGLAMGLVMLGSASKKALGEMLIYAHETLHEKIIRGLAMGISLVMYGREEEADTLIEQLLVDKDPLLRYGAMYTLALAYNGTANNSAIQRLLHIAVSDVSDDVRRAAVIALGFILSRQPKQCPRFVALLAESYNPHVRYGAALAVGLACAGSGLKEAIDILEPMTNDAVDFVRQGALIALAMVLIQYNETQEPKVAQIRKLFTKIIGDKHEDVMAKMGAIIATGIIDAGGRNVTIALNSRSGHRNLAAIAGLAVFTQFWYWHPLLHFISLAFTPTAIIGLNQDLQMPQFTFKSNAPPSFFAYPPFTKPPTTVAPTKVATVVLSTTAKQKLRDRAKEKKDGDSMDIDEPKKDEKPITPEEPKKEEEKVEEKKPEEKSEILKNPARVTLAQQRYITFDVDERYTPIVGKNKVYGIVMLKDTKPNEKEVLVSGSNVVIHEKQPTVSQPIAPKEVPQTPIVTGSEEPAPPPDFNE